MFTDKSYALNTLILSLLWSTSAYSFYFTEFYMKYVPVKNIYYLAIMMGLSDMLTSLLYVLASRLLHNKTLITLCQLFLCLSSSLLTVALYFNASPSNSQSSLTLELFYSMTIFCMRFFSALSFMCSYQANNDYFPTLLKGAIFALTNIAARLASVFSPVVAESMVNPSVTVAVISGVTLFASLKLT